MIEGEKRPRVVTLAAAYDLILLPFCLWNVWVAGHGILTGEIWEGVAVAISFLFIIGSGALVCLIAGCFVGGLGLLVGERYTWYLQLIISVFAILGFPHMNIPFLDTAALWYLSYVLGWLKLLGGFFFLFSFLGRTNVRAYFGLSW